MSRYIHILLGILLPAILTTSCVDDTRFEVPTVGDGDGTLEVTVAYDYDTDVVLQSRMADYTGGDKGSIIQDVKTLYMAVYNEDGSLNRLYKVIGPGGVNDHDPEINGVTNTSNDNRTEEEKAGQTNNPDRPLHDTSTGYVKYNMTITSGRYYIYAIANVADITTQDISTRDKLKNISIKWNDKIIAENCQMFGVYTVGEGNRDADDSNYIVVPATKSKLHSWVRRLASKVTVAFDGTQLYDNVQVYISDITIKDIPRSCKLGVSNRAGQLPDGTMAAANKLNDDSFENGVFRSGKTITVQDLTANGDILPTNYFHVCNSKHPYLGIGDDKEENSSATIDKTHSPTAQSLFFFENNQGLGKKKHQHKPDNDKEIWYDKPVEGDDESGWKDNLPWGTYVEVTGHYRCVANNQHVSSGTIKYRYMLGQNDSTDYNAIRNTHYKLTLRLKGFGNDYDWHIDYVEKPGLHVTTPQYISYLYNKQMYITLKYVGELPEDAYILGEVDGLTSWKPWGRQGDEVFPEVDKSDYYSKEGPDDGVINDGPWNAFLSLQKSNRIKIEDPDYVGTASNNTPRDTKYNKTYYEKEEIGWRIYDPRKETDGSNEPGQRGRYNVSYVRDDKGAVKQTILSIPLHTRAKELITATGFAGNNPYWSHPRYGKVNFSVCDKSGNKLKGYDPVSVEVIQVRRILNPKGIWRRSGSSEPFHVNLKHLLDQKAKEYTSVKSIGPWSAEVITGNKSMITLSSTPEGSGTLKPQIGVWRIEGSSECPIDFNINFKGVDGCAIIKIRYHNYTCEHDIFVREGYEPIAIADNGRIWSSFNVLRFDDAGNAVFTKNPIQEGSMFRRYSTVGIAALNSKDASVAAKVRAPAGYIFKVYPKGTSPITNLFWSSGKKYDATWANLKGTRPEGDTIGSQKNGAIVQYDWEIKNSDMEIAACEDYYELIAKETTDLTFPIQKAYGIVYGDGASETLSNREFAQGYDDEEGGDSPKGMLGVVVYNNTNANQIFFPLGMSGHGHRKHSGGWRNDDPDGTMRYASRSKAYSETDPTWVRYVPLFEDLYDRPGAIYWCKHDYSVQPYYPGTEHLNGSKSSSFDFNFFTMGFNGYNLDANTSSDGTKSHACFIRTVKRKPTTK